MFENSNHTILLLSILILIAILFMNRQKGAKKTMTPQEYYTALSQVSGAITSKASLTPNDTSSTNASANNYNVYAIKSAATIGNGLTVTPGWSNGTQVYCTPTQANYSSYPTNYYTAINTDATCAVAPDVTGATDAASFNTVDSNGRMYLKPETIIASTLRSGTGKSCTSKYVSTYGSALVLDTTSGKYFKYASVAPTCVTTADDSFYTGPTAVPYSTISGSTTYA